MAIRIGRTMNRLRNRNYFLLILVTVILFIYCSTDPANNWLTNIYYDQRGYLMTRSKEQTFNLQSLAQQIRAPHRMNAERFQEFKKEFLQYVDPEKIVITKENMKIGDEVTLLFDKSVRVRVDEQFYNLLPSESPLKKAYSSCSLVGSSGILKDSRCGKDIDRSEFVIRMNAPPLANYVNDVGLKANLTTMNPSIVAKRYYHLIRKSDKDSFLTKMKEFKTFLAIPVFSTPKGYGISVNVAQTIKNTNGYPVKPIFVHPDHFLSSSRYWRETGLDAERISSGLYMLSLAVTMCDEVKLYGFWPFHYDHNNKTVDYHYYGQGFVPLPTVHNFAAEFRRILGLHNKGRHQGDGISQQPGLYPDKP